MSAAIEVVADPAAAAAERIAAVVADGGHVALTGGSTPRGAYRRLAAMDLDWTGVDLWLGDDRCVPAADERSNEGMVRAELVDRIPADRAPRACHPTFGELGPDGAADAFEAELRRAFGTPAAPPALDLILLGIGPDAHTASLFPGKPALDVLDRWVVGVPEAGMEPYVPRVTLTLPVLNAAREVLFLVSGAGKADAVARAFGAGSRPGHDAPSSLVRPADGRLTVLLDEGAAARLDAAG